MKRYVYVVFVHPSDYRLFTKVVQTCIEGKRLISFSATTIKRKRAYLNEARNREDWWTPIRKMQKAIGRRMKKSKRCITA